MKISVIGLGFVGSAMFESFTQMGVSNLAGYDKYKNIGSIEECIDSSIIFMALPTQYNESASSYDKSSILEVLSQLSNLNFDGLIVIKSTVEPKTTMDLSERFKNLALLHNPEFLTERTALFDFNNQSHIVLGFGPNCKNKHREDIINFYKKYYPLALISQCTSDESESMKIFANSFYAVKVQFFNELYVLCKSIGINYTVVKDLMLKNNWINPMHTNVPGPDGKLSYGGSCFPKDTNALLKVMQKHGTSHKVLEATILERDEMRNDNTNVIKK
jgi:UDPglucose 6-dehydrogenase